MNRTIIITLALLLSISFTGMPPLRSQVAPREQFRPEDFFLPAKLKVAVHVNSEIEIHQSIVESHIKSELRRLDDVEIVKYTSTFPEWEYLIDVNIMEGTYKTTGELTGDACICTIFYMKIPLKHFRPDSIDLFTKFPTVFFRLLGLRVIGKQET